MSKTKPKFRWVWFFMLVKLIHGKRAQNLGRIVEDTSASMNSVLACFDYVTFFLNIHRQAIIKLSFHSVYSGYGGPVKSDLQKSDSTDIFRLSHSLCKVE